MTSGHMTPRTILILIFPPGGLTLVFLESDGRTVELYGPQVSGGLFGPGVGIGVRKHNLSLVKPFDDALVSIKADGTLKAISDRWFNADLSAD